MILKALVITVIVVAFVMLFMLLIIKNKYITEKIKIFKLKTFLLVNKKEEAKKYALKMVDKYPNNCLAHKILGELYEKERNFNAALSEYIRAVETNEQDYEMHYKVAILLQKTEKKEEAIIMLQDLLKMKPDYLEASLLLGNILYDEERFKEAITVYTTALRYNPTAYELYYNMGMTFTRLNDFQRAREFYEKAATLNSYLYNGQYNLALIAMIQGELEEAEKCFQRALQSEELEPIVYFYLAQIALMKGDKQAGLNYINLALELDRNLEKKVAEQPLYAVIQDRIRVPNETRKIKITLSKKERLTNKYLEEMFNLVDSLNGGKPFTPKENTQTKQQIVHKENEKEREN
ncbi:MAG: tetratricopeptide repeat protein [Clostridia bacterium]|nr:tetratricopeptide repeat protein [Clostridia bacterium]